MDRESENLSNVLVIGGAGFIGSHLVYERLRSKGGSVRIYDNFSSGKMWHLDDVRDDPRVQIVKGDVKDIDDLDRAMKGMDVVYHFASNPDIAKAVTQPDIDFWEGTYLTNNILESMRRNGVKRLFYASGSGIYGDKGFSEVDEHCSPLLPISTYGASKLACEALICSYCHMFDMDASAFRFANVVGAHQTHGVGYDFVRNLLRDPSVLDILGDGTQSKSYIYVTDIVSAIDCVERQALKGFAYFNVATLDWITVNEIAEIVVAIMGLGSVRYRYAGGDRGWKGDVPVVRLSSKKIRQLGWKNQFTCRDAIKKSVESIYEDAKHNKFGW
jgi:UDP-glucose 4-epimerase